MGRSTPEPELAEATEELYRLDPADFVPARNTLVRRLRANGQRDLARSVADLRRPSPAAWAVNQLARRHREALNDLLRLGDTLRRAQTQTLAGADAGLLRQAGRARREAVASLADSAVNLLAERGQGGAHHTEIAATLEAASLDPQAGAEASEGRLTSALEPPSGFGDLDPDVDHPTADPQRPEPSEPDPSAAEADPSATKAVVALAEAERVASTTAKRASDLSEKARQATALAARRQQEVADAEADEAQLQRDLDEARGRVAAGRRSADRAQKAAESADAAAAEAAERRRGADQRVAELRAHDGCA